AGWSRTGLQRVTEPSGKAGLECVLTEHPVCLCVCVYLCMCVFMRLHVLCEHIYHMCLYVCIWVYVSNNTLNLCVCQLLCLCFLCIHIHVHLCLCVCVYVCVCTFRRCEDWFSVLIGFTHTGWTWLVCWSCICHQGYVQWLWPNLSTETDRQTDRQTETERGVRESTR